MAKRVIAVEFDAELVPARELARAIDLVARLVDGGADVYTQGFRPTEWPKSEAVITIDQA
jgi:hypothetical protein